MTESEIVKCVYSAYRSAGMTDAGAWGMLGNAKCESGLCPYRLQGDFTQGFAQSEAYTQKVDSEAIGRDQFIYRGPNGGGYGFYQWTWQPRKAALYDMAKDTRRSIGDLTLAVDFSLHELKTDFAVNVWTVLCKTGDIREASDIICRLYENPDVKNYSERYNAAVMLRDKYGDAVKTEAPDPETPATEPETPAVDDDGIEIPETWPPRTIDRHCEGFPEIRLAQSALECHGYTVIVNGIFSDTMYYKVKAFQAEHSLKADAVIGPMTWKELLKL